MSDITEQRMMAHTQSVNLLLVMVRFQKAVLEKIKGKTGKVNVITKLIEGFRGKRAYIAFLADFHFLQDRANFWQTDLF